MQFFNTNVRLFKMPFDYYFHNRSINIVQKELIKTIQTGDKVSVIRTVTHDDIMNFAKLTGDLNPIHIAAKKKLVHGALLNGFLSGVIGTKLPGPGTIIIDQYINYLKPCYADDIIEITVEILSARKIIKCGYRIIVINSGSVVMEGEGKFITGK